MKIGLIHILILFSFLNCTLQRSPIATQEAVSENVTPVTNGDICLTPEEQNLYSSMMAYRKEKGLPAIPLSASLTNVAQTHVRDLQENQPVKGRCNLHSWSKAYGDCCYTDDHRNAACMWDKPRELTDYTGNGYEISHWSSAGATATSALRGWQNSSGHNNVMINRNIWKDVNWQAVGIGIHREYAVVWFGKERDPAGRPGGCN